MPNYRKLNAGLRELCGLKRLGFYDARRDGCLRPGAAGRRRKHTIATFWLMPGFGILDPKLNRLKPSAI